MGNYLSTAASVTHRLMTAKMLLNGQEFSPPLSLNEQIAHLR